MFTASDGGGEPRSRPTSASRPSWTRGSSCEDIEIGGERNRGLFVLKSRGMAHSNQIREFLLTARGYLLDVSVSSGEVLMGSARLAMEAREKADEMPTPRDADRKNRLFEPKRGGTEARVSSIRPRS